MQPSKPTHPLSQNDYGEFWRAYNQYVLEIFDQNAMDFVLQLGAASAVILLIFKDTILGFVASIQVSINDIVRIGDWITFSKYGAE